MYFKNFLTILLILLTFLLWLFPAYLIYLGLPNQFGMLYLPIVEITFCIGHILRKEYY